ncbi:hypothetical protein, partial [Dysosmobacter sp.]|uniref:hypothetical protein n=1 Tax=Dysosmobacter sp. TaxID=2591382 RepID=UPI002630FDE2
CYTPDYPASGLYLLAVFGMAFFSPQFFFISLLTFYLQTLFSRTASWLLATQKRSPDPMGERFSRPLQTNSIS